MTVRGSLFDAPVSSPSEAASSWVTGALSGSLATALCVVAVALLGVLMLRGRLPVRDGVQVVVGCFLLFGASVLAAGLMGAGVSRSGYDRGAPAESPGYVAEVPPPPPPSNYDPYAGASIRQDRR